VTLRTKRRKGDLTATHLVATPTTTRTLCGKPIMINHQWLDAAVTEAAQGHDILFCTKCVMAAEERPNIVARDDGP